MSGERDDLLGTISPSDTYDLALCSKEVFVVEEEEDDDLFRADSPSDNANLSELLSKVEALYLATSPFKGEVLCWAGTPFKGEMWLATFKGEALYLVTSPFKGEALYLVTSPFKGEALCWATSPFNLGFSFGGEF